MRARDLAYQVFLSLFFVFVFQSTVKKRLTPLQSTLRAHFKEHTLPKLVEGSVKVWVEKVFDWTEIGEAHKLMEGNGTRGKVVCRIS